MEIQELVSSIQKKMWLTIATKNKINKWDVMEYTGELLYYSKETVGKPEYQITIKECRTCGKEFDIRHREGFFHVKKKCECGGLGKTLTIEKLLVFFEPDRADDELTKYNLGKTIGFKSSNRYWLAAGYSEEEAAEQVRLEQTRRSAKSPASQKGASKYSVRCRDYWIDRGYTEQESRAIISELQKQNGLEWHVARYGVEEGTRKYQDRMRNWSTKMAETAKTGKSAIATTLFEAVDPDKIGKYDKFEQYVWAGKSYRVDYIRGTKIIEFFGDYWHANPRIYKEDDIMIGGLPASAIWERDNKKLEDLKLKGYSVIIVWEDEYRKDPLEAISRCRSFLENNR